MFEKEAEEYAEKVYGNSTEMDYYRIADAFKDGAEFGYNKAKEDADEMKSRFLELCNLKDMRIAELEKANEWHYVKDELPPLDTNVLVIHKWHRTPEVGKRITVFPHSSVWVWAMCCDRYRYTSEDKDVIAWKEIGLPKENE